MPRLASEQLVDLRLWLIMAWGPGAKDRAVDNFLRYMARERAKAARPDPPV